VAEEGVVAWEQWPVCMSQEIHSPTKLACSGVRLNLQDAAVISGTGVQYMPREEATGKVGHERKANR
jgi:hypothetical protein